jgi:hypothetical protein
MPRAGPAQSSARSPCAETPANVQPAPTWHCPAEGLYSLKETRAAEYALGYSLEIRYNPGGWRTAYPASGGVDNNQRDAYGPLRPAVSNQTPSTFMNVWPALA